MNPFKWEHVLIPIVPSYLFDILEAPVPYIVGLNKDPAAYSPRTIFSLTGSVVIIGLDSGSITAEGPVTEFNTLKVALSSIKSDYEKVQQHQQHKEHRIAGPDAAASFVCKTIRDAIKGINKISPLPLSSKGEDANLEAIKEQVKKEAAEADKEFIAKFTETQMFASYIEERYLAKSTSHMIVP